MMHIEYQLMPGDVVRVVGYDLNTGWVVYEDFIDAADLFTGWEITQGAA